MLQQKNITTNLHNLVEPVRKSIRFPENQSKTNTFR
jgi:hypothetical protein